MPSLSRGEVDPQTPIPKLDNGSRDALSGDLATAHLCFKVAERKAAKLGVDAPIQMTDPIIDGEVIEEDGNG